VSKIADCLKYSERHIKRVIKELRGLSQEEKDGVKLVFRSVNKQGSRGRQIIVCNRDWYDAHGELFGKTAEGVDRGLRRSFEEGESPIKGVTMQSVEPSDILKKIIKNNQTNNTSKQSLQRLRRISYYYSGQMDRSGLLEVYHRSQMTPQSVRNIYWKYLKAGYWRDDITTAMKSALKLSHIAVTDGLARSGFAYCVFGVEDKLKKINISETKVKLKEYFQKSVDFVKDNKKEFIEAGLDTELPAEIKERCNHYQIDYA
jgi:hypothetical protein